MRFFLFLTLFICSLGISAYGQGTASLEENEIITTFFELLKDKGPAQAVNYLYGPLERMEDKFPASSDISSRVGSKERLIKELSQAMSVAGSYQGYAPIIRKVAGGSLSLNSYLVKFEFEPMRFTFRFYQPLNEWVFYDFRFDQKIMEELDEAATLKEIYRPSK